MTMVEASLQNEAGMLLTVPARMELKSANGACIRVKTPISVGSKLSIQWRFDKFTGIARNIRNAPPTARRRGNVIARLPGR